LKNGHFGYYSTGPFCIVGGPFRIFVDTSCIEIDMRSFEDDRFTIDRNNGNSQ
jgi:hypothetical protein